MAAGDRTRTSYHHGALREALLGAARGLLAERGAAAFSLSELARRVGVSAAAPYRHFADREALLDALADEGYVALGAGLDEAARTAPDPGERVIRLGVAYLRFAEENPAVFDIMFRERPGPQSAAGPPAFQILVTAVEQAQEAGALPSGQPAPITARTVWATIHGLAVLSARGGFAKLGLGEEPYRLMAESFAVFLRDRPGR
ncbi:TetR/AcrR family transcriptional regulator [Planomonospora venezuelensis]|uniref:AcrR family transcriptional regulator n=1 Tax=Planomonospora venezuelensis TaxID=1999 RepID=A0A841CXW7_PLAVE|nr:TetR/AcrR family transcriptional regulator [Planomonospora venezuelensis]MBB5960968.1 AcrR family transcriptional regulator [Planomonospora venezuelensis]GIN01202.1 TetR family transcriptional regulator [Planomonospora venezuelensis]